MNTENEFSTDQLAEKVLAECLRKVTDGYLELLTGNNNAAIKSCSKVLCHLSTCLSEASFTSFASEDDTPEDPNDHDEMDEFYSKEED